MRGYYFVGPTVGDDAEPVWADDEWHTGPLTPFLHMPLQASKSAFDALQYAMGSTLCRVELGGKFSCPDHAMPEYICGTQVKVWEGEKRRILERIDATAMLRRFAADQALGVAHLWEMPPIVREYLRTLDPDPDAAYAASEAIRPVALYRPRWSAESPAAWAAMASTWEEPYSAAKEAAASAATARTWLGAQTRTQPSHDGWVTSNLVVPREDDAIRWEATRKEFDGRVKKLFC